MEATLILPLFLAVMGLFLFFFQVFLIQTRMESAIDSVGRKCAVYWYGVEALQEKIAQGKENSNEQEEQTKETLLSKIGTELVQDGITVLYVRNEVLKQYGDKDSYYTWIKNEKKGISFLGSGISEGGTVLKIVVTYEIEIPFLANASFRCVQSCWKRLWTGEDYEGVQNDSESNEDVNHESEGDEYVYVTKNGQVYHTTIQCSYLKRTVNAVTSATLPSSKNDSGQSYTACELCCGEEEARSIYYVTTTGTRYHVTIECSSLVRYIEKRLFSEVGNLRGCTKCILHY